MKSIGRLISLSLLAFLATVLVASCNQTTTAIKIGSKDFTEQFILGEMYALVLENRGLPVERKLNLGGTPVAQASLINGEIDIYPEYTGTALLTVLKLPTNSDPQQVFDTVARAYQDEFNLVWLQPAPMNNTTALAMTATEAEKFGIRTISDMVTHASELIILAPPEFAVREDSLPGLKRVYGDFEFKEFKAVDPGLRYKGLQQGEGNIVTAFGTDGEINALGLVVLKDDKGLFPPYQVAPVVRREVLDAHPEIREILNALSAKLTNETMQRLNYEVSGKEREPADVAKEFLIQEQLLTP